MKKFILLLFSAMLIGATVSCSDSKEESDYIEKTPIGTVTLTQGVMHYDSSSRHWFISHYIEGTIDQTEFFYPTALGKSFMSEGLHVTFSGNLYEMEFNVNRLGGAKYYCIDLTHISKEN